MGIDRLDQAVEALSADIDDLLRRYRRVKEDRELLLTVLHEIMARWGYPNTAEWHRAKDALDKVEIE